MSCAIRGWSRRCLRAALALLFVGASLGCRRDEATATGTEVVRWDSTMSTRVELRAARVLGSPRSADVKVTALEGASTGVVLSVHVDSAEIAFVEDGEERRQTAPVSVRATVTDAARSVVRAGTCDGPDYAMPSADGTTAKEMLLRCHVATTNVRGNDIVAIVVRGDGAVTPTFPGRLKIGD